MSAMGKGPVIGVSSAFIGKYKASKFITNFLQLMDVPLVKSNQTKPEIIETGTTIASAEFCLPLRVYIGHIYKLLSEHPEIEYILAPIIKGEHANSSTCAKYRDLDGVIIRSLSSITSYHLNQSSFKEFDKLVDLIGREGANRFAEKAGNFPKVLAPQIESLEKSHLRKIAIQVYAEIFGVSKAKVLHFLSVKDWSVSRNSQFKQIESAIHSAYEKIINTSDRKYQDLIGDTSKMRLAIVGRNYLVDDPALSADIKNYFSKKNVAVITAEDIPYSSLKDKYEKVKGFYDSHKLNQAFIETVIEEVDGFILVGSFGCHPDAFQLDYFTKYITSMGKACWTFKFDEQTGGAGFHTRYETILGFLEQKRNERLKKELESGEMNISSESSLFNFNGQAESLEIKKPIFIWPYMGEGLNLALQETLHQLGLSDYLFPPNSVDEVTINLGNTHYTETCSPFALYYGSLKQSLDRLINHAEQARKKQEKVEPRRVVILMAGGKGPCTFGWYAIAGYKALIEEYTEKLAPFDYQLEMIALDNQGRNLISFLQELSSSAENNRIQLLINGLQKIQNKNLSIIKRGKAELDLIKLLKKIIWPAWNKLLSYEEMQGKALIIRAHENIRGSTTKELKYWINELHEAHTLTEITEVKKHALHKLEGIKQDHEVKPKVVIVGEIYVALTPFANRGTVDNLLGQLGIEAIEGMKLSHFIKGAFKGLKYDYIQNQELLKRIYQFVESKSLYNKNDWVREPTAKPFLEHEIGGDGQPTIAHARKHIEQDGVDGIVHLYPFKCMPEGMAKEALIEMTQIYGVKSLHLSFDKEMEIERLKTELNTFSQILHQEMYRDNTIIYKEKEAERRQGIGKTIEKIYIKSTK